MTAPHRFIRSWPLMTARPLLTAHDLSWPPLTAHDRDAHDHSWLLMTAPACSWQRLTAHGRSWPLMNVGCWPLTPLCFATPTHTRAHTHTQYMHARTDAHTHNPHARTSPHRRTHTHKHKCTFFCLYMCVCVCACVFVCVCVGVQVLKFLSDSKLN